MEIRPDVQGAIDALKLQDNAREAVNAAIVGYSGPDSDDFTSSLGDLLYRVWNAIKHALYEMGGFLVFNGSDWDNAHIALADASKAAKSNIDWDNCTNITEMDSEINSKAAAYLGSILDANIDKNVNIGSINAKLIKAANTDVAPVIAQGAPASGRSFCNII